MTAPHAAEEFAGGGWLSRIAWPDSEKLKTLLLVLAANAIFFALVLLFATPYYETNDDRAMQLIASGAYTGHPSECLVFTHVLIGWVLRILYTAWDGCNWYFWYLVAAHFAALTAIAFLALRRNSTWPVVVLYVAFLVFVELRILLNLQFTTTAFLVGVAGLLLMVDGASAGQPIERRRLLWGLFFTAFAVMIREAAVILLTLIAAPFVLERFGKQGIRKVIAIGFACVCGAVALHEMNAWYYRRDAEWNDFLQYNELRGRIHRTALEAFVPKVAAEIGWSRNDAQMFSDWYFGEPEVYGSLSRMRQLFDKVQLLASAQSTSGLPHIRLFLPKLFGGDAGTLMDMALITAVCCVLAAGPRRGRWLITLLATYAVCTVLASYLRQTARLPQRVSLTMPLFLHLVCLYWASLGLKPWSRECQDDKSAACLPERPSWLQRLRPALSDFIPLGAGLYLFFGFEMAKSLFGANQYNSGLKRVSEKILQPIQSLAADRKPLILAMPLDSALERSMVFLPPSGAPFSLIPYGWLAHSPLYQEILNQHQLHPYSMSLVDRPSTFFVMEPRWIAPLTTFYREHYGKEIRFDLVLSTDTLPQYRDCALHVYVAKVNQPALSTFDGTNNKFGLAN